MDARKNTVEAAILAELRRLKKGQGVQGDSFSSAIVLRQILGTERRIFTRNLNLAIDRFVFDERQQNSLVIALNTDDAQSSDNLSLRRYEFEVMFGISTSTAFRCEREASRHLAKGLADECPYGLDELLSGKVLYLNPTSQPDNQDIIERLNLKVKFFEREIAEMKLLISQLR